MEEKILQQYDAHVKDYQRHLLIEILESTKSKAIQNLIEKKAPLPEGRIYVPRPQTDVVHLSIDPPIGILKNESIIPHGLTPPTMVSIPDISPNLGEISGLSVCKIQPQNTTIKTNVNIDKEAFSDIPTRKIDIPNNDFNFSPQISEIINTVSLPSFPETTPSLSYHSQIEKDNFDVHLPKITITDNQIDTTIMISEKVATDNTFSAIDDLSKSLKYINAPQNLTLPPITINKDIAKDTYSIQERLNRSLAQINAPLNLTLPSMNKGISKDIHVDITLPKNVGQLSADVPSVQIEQPIVKLPKTAELPDLFVQSNMSEEINTLLNTQLPEKVS